MKSSSPALFNLTLYVKGDNVVAQELFVQHGLSVGRNQSNTICIDEPSIDRIHSQIQRQADGTMVLNARATSR